MDELAELFSYQFIVNALWAVIFTSLIAGIVGTYIVTRRMVFVGGGITHASFGGIGIAYYYGLPPFLGAAVFAILSALGIEWMNIKGKVREDSAIAIIWSFGMAVGILFMFLSPGYAPNLMGFLFGDILTVTTADLFWLAGLSLLLSLLMLFFYRPIMYVAFDSDFAQITGWPVKTIRFAIVVLVAGSIVLAIKVTGIILVLSLFTIPQTIANIRIRKFVPLMVYSVAISIVLGIAGLFLAYFFDLPTGAIIIFLLSSVYLLARIGLWIGNKLGKKQHSAELNRQM